MNRSDGHGTPAWERTANERMGRSILNTTQYVLYAVHAVHITQNDRIHTCVGRPIAGCALDRVRSYAEVFYVALARVGGFGNPHERILDQYGA